ncbi:MAG: hypothetical protein O2968_02780 [Acidobacteria bacterium]|nr:hypothetical protein [Acidobacteriota bacterium]
MASASPQLVLDELADRRFSFYPSILNVEHNEWTLARETWSEVLVSNVASSVETWIPRTYLGSISHTDSPVLIVGLTRELEWNAGKIWPHQKRVIEMPGRKSQPRDTAAADMAAPPPRRESRAESSIGRLLIAALSVGLLATLFLVMYAFDALRNPLDVLFPADTTTADQRYLGLTGSAGREDIFEKVGRPEQQEWISRPEAEIQFEVLWYPSRSYALIMMGVGREGGRYIGAIHIPSRTMLDSVKLPRGGSTASMLRNLPEF